MALKLTWTFSLRCSYTLYVPAFVASGGTLSSEVVVILVNDIMVDSICPVVEVEVIE